MPPKRKREEKAYSDLDLACWQIRPCTLSPGITVDEFHDYFAENGANPCQTRVLHLDASRNVVVCDDLLYKKEPDCTLLYQNVGDYYYVYDASLFDFLSWAEDRVLAQDMNGYVGHHLTMGMKSGAVDVHHTVYETRVVEPGKTVFTKKLQRAMYHINRHGELVPVRKHEEVSPFARGHAKAVWARVACHVKHARERAQDQETETGTPSGGSGRSARPRKRALHAERVRECVETLREGMRVFRTRQSGFTRIALIDPDLLEDAGRVLLQERLQIQGHWTVAVDTRTGSAILLKDVYRP